MGDLYGAAVMPRRSRRGSRPGSLAYTTSGMIRVTAAILERDGQIFLARRGAGRRLAGYWEFPGGKIEAGETPQQCLRRELFEELGILARVGGHFQTVIHRYPEGVVQLEAYRVEYFAGEFVLRDHDAVSWLSPDRLSEKQLAPADVPIAVALGACIGSS